MNKATLRFVTSDGTELATSTCGMWPPVPRQGETVSIPGSDGQKVHFLVERVSWDLTEDSFVPTVWLRVGP